MELHHLVDVPEGVFERNPVTKKGRTAVQGESE